MDVWLCCLNGGLHYWCLGRFCFSFCVLLVDCVPVAVVCWLRLVCLWWFGFGVAQVTCYLLRLLSVWLACLFSVGYRCCVLVVLGWVLLVCVVGCFAWRVFALVITLWWWLWLLCCLFTDFCC